MFVDVVYAAEGLAARYGECQRPHLDLKLALNLVQQVERILARAVELVDEDHDGRVAHAAYVHQLARLRLDTLRAVYYDDDRIDGRERAVGILGEILMARGVEDVDLDILVVETHDRRCDRDAALALDLHEIGRGALLYLVALDGSCHMYGPAEEEQFLGKGSLSRIGVRYDCKGSALGYFVDQRHDLRDFISPAKITLPRRPCKTFGHLSVCGLRSPRFTACRRTVRVKFAYRVRDV